MEGQGFGTSQQRCLPRVSRPTPRGVLPLSLCLPISHVHAWRVGRQGFLLGQSDAHTGLVGPTRLTARAAPAVNTALEISAGLNLHTDCTMLSTPRHTSPPCRARPPALSFAMHAAASSAASGGPVGPVAVRLVQSSLIRIGFTKIFCAHAPVPVASLSAAGRLIKAGRSSAYNLIRFSHSPCTPSASPP
jgi:hypothetical protein